MPNFKGVVVRTPGRVFDMLRRHSLHPDYIKMFVLDEADKMLSKSFKDQIYDIFQLLPSKDLGWCFLYYNASWSSWDYQEVYE